MQPSMSPSTTRMQNKVPEITVFFWIIKIVATTVGETAADFLNSNLNFGLTPFTPPGANSSTGRQYCSRSLWVLLRVTSLRKACILVTPSLL